MKLLSTPIAINQLIDWLLAGDVSIQYQVHRDLLGSNQPELQARIAAEGWGAAFLNARKNDGNWGQSFYQPKWTSTHYTLLDLRNLNIAKDHELIRESVAQITNNLKAKDGGINPPGSTRQSDVCINGMFLNYASYFGMEEKKLNSVVDFLLTQHMPDGGFNCQSNRGGARHSSMGSTVCVLEGILEYAQNGYRYRLGELQDAALQAQEFLLQHRLYRSDHTGEIIDRRFLMLSYPPRYRYDILRALDYFQSAGCEYDPRMADAITVLQSKRRKDGRWPHQGKHPGQVHFDMEKSRRPSRWNTLRVFRIFKHFNIPLMA